jgi:hypothetical protein
MSTIQKTTGTAGPTTITANDVGQAVFSAGNALMMALRTGPPDSAASSKAEVALRELADVVKACAPELLDDRELRHMTQMAAWAMSSPTEELQLAGAGLTMAVGEARGALATKEILSDPNPIVKSALAVLKQLGEVEVGITMQGNALVKIGQTKKCDGPLSSTTLSGWYESPRAAVVATAEEITQKGVGIAWTDPKDGERKPMTWNGEKFVEARYDDTSQMWLPK